MNWKERVPLTAVTPFTLQDFPERTACIFWLSGCQMRCPYCHNPEMALGKGKRLDVDAALAFMASRRSQLDGVGFSGGECLLSEAVVELIRETKRLGYQVKVDTNGGFPDRLGHLLEQGLIDYVAMDFKAPPERYEQVTGWGAFERWERCYDLLAASAIDWELRTTVHTDLVDEEAVDTMMDYLERRGFAKRLFLQRFRSGETLGWMPEMRRRFDLDRLRLPRRFEIDFRNFTRSEIPAAGRQDRSRPDD